MSSGSGRFAGRRIAARFVLVWLPVVLTVAACVSAVPGATGNASPVPTDSRGSDRLRQQAQAALQRWAAAVGKAKGPAVVFVGDLTGQVGDWEESVGGNNKNALMTGAVRPAASLPTEAPPPGEIHWSDGISMTVDLLSAGQAVDELVTSAGPPCTGCRPLEITSARLATVSIQTSRGLVTAPAWEFTLKGTNVKVTRVAVADRISVVPPPWDPYNPPEGLPVDAARGKADSRQFTVSFVGAPDQGDKPCGADYTAEAVESQLAVVVIVVEHPNQTAAACRLVGAVRTAVVTLASPLGDRAILEVKEGLPVPVLAP